MNIWFLSVMKALLRPGLKQFWKHAGSQDTFWVYHQATPLTVEHLKTIHQVLHSDSDPWDKCFAGMLLFCVYARARWSDAQRSEKVIGDRDEKGELFLIECSTAVHKTARALQMRHMFLPLVAPARGVEAECWGEPWLAARNVLGIEDLRRFPLMPAPDASGDATIRPVSTSEASSWLEHLLTKTHGKLLGKRYTSHSLKATMLSYLAKRGVPFEDRLALGYHFFLRMALTYSRDGASRPLAVLCDMLAEIRKGVFSPDVTRSGPSEVADVALVPSDVVELQFLKQVIMSLRIRILTRKSQFFFPKSNGLITCCLRNQSCGNTLG